MSHGCLSSNMVSFYASNADYLIDMTVFDTDSTIGEYLGNLVGPVSRRLQFVFCKSFIFWKEQENQVALLVGVFLMFVVFLGVFSLASCLQSCLR